MIWVSSGNSPGTACCQPETCQEEDPLRRNRSGSFGTEITLLASTYLAACRPMETAGDKVGQVNMRPRKPTRRAVV